MKCQETVNHVRVELKNKKGTELVTVAVKMNWLPQGKNKTKTKI